MSDIEIEFEDNNYSSTLELIQQWRKMLLHNTTQISTLSPQMYEKYQQMADMYFDKCLTLAKNGTKFNRFVWCFRLHQKYSNLINQPPRIWLENAGNLLEHTGDKIEITFKYDFEKFEDNNA